MPTMGVKSGQIKSINRQTMQQTWRRKRVKCNKNTSHKAKTGPGIQTWTSLLQENAKQQILHLVVEIFGLHSIVHLGFNKMCQAQLKSGPFCRLRLKSELSSLNCSYCYSASGRIPRTGQYQKLSNLAAEMAKRTGHRI